jgi:hypothetical protein
MLQTKCLVVGSCTGQKDDEGCPEELKLKEADFGTAGCNVMPPPQDDVPLKPDFGIRIHDSRRASGKSAM